ncbi:hypothetical protein [Rosettibacter firmus]|uniref:hypothetical protein n=1 Tax=Rosettibacter firmus TaxID=3111522 RepID=UPI00336BEE39
MKKLFFLTLLHLFLVAQVLSQPKYSIQINGGLLMPNSNDKGLTANIQLNYLLGESVYLYFNSGISSWDKNIISYATGNRLPYTSYSEDDHLLIYFYTGIQKNLKSVKTFNIYFTVDVGYNYLKYNKYKNIILIDEDTKELIKFDIEPGSGRRESKNLIGAGIGIGINNMMSENFGISVSGKMNNLFYLLKEPKTQYSIMVSFIFKI